MREEMEGERKRGKEWLENKERTKFERNDLYFKQFHSIPFDVEKKEKIGSMILSKRVFLLLLIISFVADPSRVPCPRVSR